MPRSLSRPWSSRPRLERLEEREVLSVAPAEQLFVYLLNRARHDPVAYQQANSLPVSLGYVSPRPPLAVNDLLFDSSEFKAEEMLTYNYFSHQSQVTGVWPNKLVRDSGYNLPSSFVDNNNYLESISYGWAYPGHNPAVATAGATLRGLIIDSGVNPPGHRNHLLGINAWNAQFREVGVGHASRDGAYNYDYWAVHTGYVHTTDVFLTGVVYNDSNGNLRYDLNEGLAGVTIQAGPWSTTTNAAGGWSIQVNPSASYSVTASGAGFVGASSAVVNAGTDNVEVDFISGRDGAQVNFTDGTAAVNHAPVLGAAVALTAISEDTATTGDLVSKLLGNASDADASAQRGVAVTGATGGTWQFFDGSQWRPVGAVADGSALLLPAGYRLRLLPPVDWNGQATLTYRAWDRTSGQAADLVDLSAADAVGGSTAFSAAEATTTLTVKPVNDAPVQPATAVVLPGISRGASPATVAVSGLLAGATDAEGAALGVAIVSASGRGVWQYSTNGGQTWQALGSPSRSAARLLGGNDLLRFTPPGLSTGVARLSFLAWDRASGTAGSAYPLPAITGGSTAFSRDTRAARLQVDDAPVLGAGVALTAMFEDKPTAGEPVSRLLANVTDADPKDGRGAAVTATTGNGTWQFFDGTRWAAVGAVSQSAARLLRAGDRVRFVPAANWSGPAALTYRAWDRVFGVAGHFIDLSQADAVGGHTSFSATEATATLDVRPVNDAPWQPSTTLTVSSALVVSTLLAGASDVEGAALGVAIIGASGAWQFSTDGGQSWQALGSPSRSAARLLGGNDLLRFTPLGSSTARLSFVAWDRTLGNAGDVCTLPTTLGGATPFSRSVRTAQVP